MSKVNDEIWIFRSLKLRITYAFMSINGLSISNSRTRINKSDWVFKVDLFWIDLKIRRIHILIYTRRQTSLLQLGCPWSFNLKMSAWFWTKSRFFNQKKYHWIQKKFLWLRTNQYFLLIQRNFPWIKYYFFSVYNFSACKSCI